MNRFSALQAEVVQLLKGSFPDKKVTVCPAFARGAREHPVRRNMLTVAIEQIDFSGGVSGAVAFTLRFDLLAPVDGGQACYQMYHRLCEVFCCKGNHFTAKRITSGEAAYDEAYGALVMTVRAEMMGVLPEPQESTGAPVRAVVLKRRNRTD